MLKFYDQAASLTQNNASARELLIARILLSPRFLYRSEVGVADGGQGVRTMTQAEIASAISYGLTGDMPDQELWTAVRAGSLTPEAAAQHAKRLLQTEKAQEWMVGFFKQLLNVHALDRMATDITDFPKLKNVNVGKGLREEFHAFVRATVFAGQGSINELFLAEKTFVNVHTAELFGQSAPSEQLVPVDTDPAQRRGILTLASVMAVHSSPMDEVTDNSIIRGSLINEAILCGLVTLHSNVDTIQAGNDARADNPDFDNLTVGAQYEAMVATGPDCQVCHSRFMPYGYMLSNLDARGRYQTVQRGQNINADVAEADLDGSKKAYSGFTEFLPAMVKSPSLSSCLTKNIARFLTGSNDSSSIATLLTEQLKQKEGSIVPALEGLMALPGSFTRKASP